jgi:group I intron endonuclease
MSLANSGENNPMFGKTHTAETIAKMSLAKSGENHPRGMQGKTHSEETLIKMSEAQGTTIYVNSSDGSTLINSFPSANKAAKHFNCDKNTILRYAKNTGSGSKIFKDKYILSINAPKLH